MVPVTSLLLAVWLVGKPVAPSPTVRSASLETDQSASQSSSNNSFIIECEPGARANDLASELSRHASVKVLRTIDLEIFCGVKIETNSETANAITSIPHARRAWPVTRYQHLDAGSVVSFSSDAQAPKYDIHRFTGVSEVHATGNYGKGAKIGLIDTGVLYSHPALGGCEKVGPGCRIAGGWDFAGDFPDAGPDDDPLPVPAPSFDNMFSSKMAHGTHVAGIIAGKSEWFLGVAPEAEIYAYKVFGYGRDTTSEAILEALQRAKDDKVDIISASIGFPSGYGDSILQGPFQKLVDEGVLIVVSAGNYGREGAFYGDSISYSPDVLAVASFEAQQKAALPVNLTFVDPDGAASVATSGIITWPPAPGVPMFARPEMEGRQILLLGDACSPLDPAVTPPLASWIPVVPRSGCSIRTKLRHLQPFEPDNVLLYDDDNGPPLPLTNTIFDEVPAMLGLLDGEAGAAIAAAAAAGINITATFWENIDGYKGEGYVGFRHANASAAPSEFSSLGPENRLALKPDIAGPGGDIYSTSVFGAIDGPNGVVMQPSWEVLSGTSMAAPYVAGVAALYVSQSGGRAVHGPSFARMLQRRIISSGMALPWSSRVKDHFEGVGERPPVSHEITAPVVKVGAGMVNAAKVLGYTTQLAFERFELNDTRYFAGEHELQITNHGAESVDYSFDIEALSGIEARAPPGSPTGYLLAISEEMMPVKILPDVKLPGIITILPGESKTVKFIFATPKYPEPSRLPLYGGRVHIMGSNGEDLAVPYFGAAFDMYEQITQLQHPGYPVLSMDRSGFASRFKRNRVTFTVNERTVDFLTMATWLDFPTTQLRWDIFDSGYITVNNNSSPWAWPLVSGQNGYIGTATRVRDPDATPDGVEDFPFVNVARDGHDVLPTKRWREPETYYSWLGRVRLSDGSYVDIEPGRYWLRWAALRPFGDPAVAEAWEVTFHEVTVRLNEPPGLMHRRGRRRILN